MGESVSNATSTTTAAIAKATDRPSLLSNLRTAVRSGAQDAPAVVREIGALDPRIATFLAGKSALGSKTLISPFVVHALTWAVGAYGLNWDATFTEAVAGFISMLIMGGLRFVTDTPIKTLLPKGNTP